MYAETGRLAERGCPIKKSKSGTVYLKRPQGPVTPWELTSLEERFR